MVLASVMLAAPRLARGAPATVLRIGYSSGTTGQLGEGARIMAERLQALTEGRVQIDSYPQSQLGGDLDMLQAMERGTLDMTINAALSSFVPELGIFEVPFLFRDIAHAHAVLDGPIGQAALRRLEARQLVGLSWGENGLRHITTTARQIRGPADMAGLKLRSAPSQAILTTFKTLGAEAAMLPFGELYAALAAGRFEAQENPIGTIESAGLWQVQKFISLTGHVYSPAGLVISRHSLERLSAADRAALEQAARDGAQASRRAAVLAQQNGLARLRDRGMTVIEVDRTAFARALAPAEAAFATMFGAEQLAAIRAVKA
ncbi:DctP family TRAP transporter solute-binding subunit [Roseomonas sp. GC11]|uniref:DctP family TRAP transporter solute-binding subunit n=1 Tax=Roseomonas sp. GC11 TaxID=2950546 RepID=UPI00210D7F58|nr:DctP family TRAP transporter solute-binding subunit [Roseomonas sp. GC11]MCQ4159857.1 DctP family TRAP transporter solute-binding subunit [Roseomonas sp. GC11]